MQGSDNDFRVEDPATITKIFLADRSNQTATLERQSDNSWMLNGKYKARQKAVDLLLKTMSQIRVRYAVNEQARANVDKMLAREGIKVEIYEGGGSPSKTYYVGTGTPDQLGSYMYLEGADKAYIVHIASWEGVLAPRYITNNDDWRDRTLFNTKADKIAEVSVEYSGSQSQYSFVFKQDNGKFTVQPFLVSTPAIDKPVVEGQAKAFMSAFEYVEAEGWETTNQKKDSVLHTSPFCTVTLKTTDNLSRSAALYPLPGRLTDDNNAGLIARAPVERYYMYVDKTDFMLGQHNVLKRMLWSYASFFDLPTLQDEGKPIKRKY